MAETYVVSINQFVEHPALDAVQKGFVDAMKEQGLDTKYNIHIAQANPSTTVQIASQILGENPNLVLAIATPSAQACAQKIKDIPVLFSAVSDPVSAGLVKSFEKPGSNVTGMSDMSPVDKQMELIKTIVPGLKTLGVIYNAGEANSVAQIDLVKSECKKLGIGVEEATVANSSGVYQAAQSLIGKCQAVYIPLDNTVVSALESAIKVAAEHKLPLFSSDTESVGRGTIAALAIDYYQMGRQTAKMAKKILVEGQKPASMPVETLDDLELMVNLKAAKSMGVDIPKAVLDKADKIIE
nr:ABC transporter substrate-binding protein [Desulfovibrio inopinatus]